jgi:hypothetical protein
MYTRKHCLVVNILSCYILNEQECFELENNSKNSKYLHEQYIIIIIIIISSNVRPSAYLGQKFRG